MEGEVDIHEGLAWMRTFEESRDWLARLPGIVDACAEEWSLTLGEPFPYAFASLACPVTREDGSVAVLKIQFPDRESEHEAAALDLIDGDGAVRLLAYDAGRRALLLERALPGTPLQDLAPDAALDVLVALSRACGSRQVLLPSGRSPRKPQGGLARCPATTSARTIRSSGRSSTRRSRRSSCSSGPRASRCW